MGEEETSPYRKILLNGSVVVSSHPKAERLRSLSQKSHQQKVIVAEDGLIIYVNQHSQQYSIIRLLSHYLSSPNKTVFQSWKYLVGVRIALLYLRTVHRRAEAASFPASRHLCLLLSVGEMEQHEHCWHGNIRGICSQLGSYSLIFRCLRIHWIRKASIF